MKNVQYFSKESLERSKDLTPLQIIRFVENYRKLHSMNIQKTESKLISIKIPVDLLDAFKTKAATEGVKYQTKIKELMKDYL